MFNANIGKINKKSSMRMKATGSDDEDGEEQKLDRRTRNSKSERAKWIFTGSDSDDTRTISKESLKDVKEK